MNIQFIIYK